VDFSVFTDFSPQWRVDPDHWFKYSEEHLGVPKEAAEFAAKIFSRSGIGRTTHLSPTLLCPPPQIDMAAARKEGMIVMTGAIDALLARTGMAARDIDILVVNCSLFNPTPSHTAMLVHHYGLPSHTITYSIAGMGCSASHIALDCARGALAVHPRRDAVAVVVSYENLTQNFYSGDQREMIVANALFRMGASAVMVSKQERVRGLRARYELDALVRHHLGADPVGYSCIYQDTDITYAAGADGRPLRQPATHGAFEKPPIQGLGVRLSKSVPVIAARGLTACIGDIALSCLSWTALAEYAARFLVFRARLAMGRVDKSAAPVPAFHRELDHFCIHAGGKAVVAGISNTLSLSEAQAAASVRTLYKYGNTSSSSVWYSLYECERGQHVPGDPRSGCDSWEEEDAHAAAAGYKRGSRYSEMDAVDVAGAIGKRDIYLGMASELSLQAVARAPCEAFRRFIREERREGVRRGERVWGVFFGSGMKIGSTVLRRL
jgi:3-ketoacyl-CoA synthase